MDLTLFVVIVAGLVILFIKLVYFFALCKNVDRLTSLATSITKDESEIIYALKNNMTEKANELAVKALINAHLQQCVLPNSHVLYSYRLRLREYIRQSGNQVPDFLDTRDDFNEYMESL